MRNIIELSIMLVETKKHLLYGLVYFLIKLVLILPVAMMSIETLFLTMNVVNIKLRHNMGDDLMNYYLVSFIE